MIGPRTIGGKTVAEVPQRTVAGAIRPTPAAVRVTLSDGVTADVPLRGGSAWRLDDPGVSLADPTLRMDGTIVPQGSS